MKSSFRFILLGLAFLAVVPALAKSSTARIVVHKKLLETGPLPASALDEATKAGYSLLADYVTMATFKGPSAAASALISTIEAGGRDAEVASDLERFSYHDVVMDAGVGPVPAAPSGQIYFLTLQTYLKYSWLQELSSRGVRILQALPPATYIVRADPLVASHLLQEFPWIRGLFPLPANLKAIGFDRPSAVPGPFRDITIRVSEESSEESLRPLLESLSDTPVSASSPQPGQMTYSASLAELDVQTLIHIDRVFEIAPLGHATISSERQAQLIGQPGSVTGNGATLPPSNPFPPDGKTYLQWLSDHGFGITANTFDNTRVGLIDTGFDNGDISYDGIHPDFKYSNGGDQTIVVDGTIRWGSFQDNDWHGTLTASVVAGYPASDRVDAAGYRWGLGVAPTVRLIVDRWLRCQVRDGTFSENVGDITGKGVNVVNASVNIGNSEGGCAYALGYSNVIDQYTASGWLFTLSAGNSTPDGCPGNYVRAPATAKNGLTVGSTDNFTLAWPNNRTDGICAWCDYAPDHQVAQDARRIPSYSAVRDPSSLVKPDLVAPSTRVTGPISRSGSCQNMVAILCNSSVDAPAYGTYAMSAGTSFAAPAAAGAAAIVRKWFRNNTYTNPSPAMTKAILINGARDIADVAVRNESYGTFATVGHIPDPYQGWGMLSFERLFGTWSNYNFYDQGTTLYNSGDQWSRTVYVRDGPKQVQITLAWTDPAGSQSTHYTTTNNLNLLVYGGSPQVSYQGNYFSNGITVQRPPGALVRDSINNVERVVIPAGRFASGTPLQIYVIGFSLQSPQNFALAAENAGQ